MKSAARQHMAGLGVLAFLACTILAAPLGKCAEPESLSELSLEELMNVEVTTVSKKPEKRSEAPAAVHVITQEDIRRSGATNLPELLRLVPGVQVARLDASKWSVTIRGSSGRYANKLLVLIDGRSVYTPLFSGVEWEARDAMLEDIERIEVIRGPGGTLWGANAVNGVINIVTKKASETAGGMSSMRAGTEDYHLGLRYGERLDDRLAYRLFGEFLHTNDSRYPSGDEAEDHWRRGHGGFRLDWNTAPDSLMLQGNAYSVDTFQRYESLRLVPLPRAQEVHGEDWSGGSLLGRWTRELDDGAALHLQAYYDRSEVRSPVLDEHRDVLDFDFQHRMEIGEKQEIVWGLGYRFTHDQLGGSDATHVDDSTRAYHLFSAFLQDEMQVTDKLRVWLGAKLEYNDFSGLEFQPGGLLAYQLNADNMFWASISRAVRTPSRIEEDGRLVSKTFPGGQITLFGEEDFNAETLTAYELGYRWNASSHLSFDFAAYYNDYGSLRSLQFQRPFVDLGPRPRLVIPLRVANNTKAEAHGAELAVEYAAKPWWRSRLGYTWLEMDVDTPRNDLLTASLDGDAPNHQMYLQNLMNLGRMWELDTTLRYVGELPSLDVDNYLTLDVRVGYKANENLEFAIVGQNLLQSTHREFAPTFVDTLETEVERSVYAEMKWRF